MEFLAEISLMIQIQLIKPVQKKQGLILDEFSHVNGCLLLFVHEGPGAKVLTVRSDGFPLPRSLRSVMRLRRALPANHGENIRSECGNNSQKIRTILTGVSGDAIP